MDASRDGSCNIEVVEGGVIRFEGEFSSWDEAAAHCCGYDAVNILEKVLDASLQVKRGVAAFERDSVLFDEIEYSWPVTAALMHVAARSGGQLYVLDFGGALGSSYFQNRKFLDGLTDVRWCVVEQEHYVEAGRNHLQDERLTFCRSIGEAAETLKPNVVLLSGVLQYLQEPYAALRELLASRPGVVLIDRTPLLNDHGPSVVKVQHTPASIYLASYPCILFDKKEFFDFFSDYGYLLLERFDALDKLDDSATWQGMIFTRKSDA